MLRYNEVRATVLIILYFHLCSNKCEIAKRNRHDPISKINETAPVQSVINTSQNIIFKLKQEIIINIIFEI